MHTSSELIHDVAPPGAPPSGDPGVRSGWAWTLPPGPGCARHARTLLADALASLAVPSETVADAKVMVSELATNAYQHAADYGPHELWLYVDDADARPPAQVRVAVFDAFADARLPGYSWTSGDCGRGLSIVAEMSQGRWGLLSALSRLGTPVQGKAVWFAVPTRVP